MLAAQQEVAKMKTAIVRAMNKASSTHEDRRAESALLKIKRLGLVRKSSTVRGSVVNDRNVEGGAAESAEV